jgi:hypothetical protein
LRTLIGVRPVGKHTWSRGTRWQRIFCHILWRMNRSVWRVVWSVRCCVIPGCWLGWRASHRTFETLL